MTYAELTTAKAKHEAAAKTIRYAGFKAKCTKNNNCEQPYEIHVETSKKEAAELQEMMQKMFNYPINVLSLEVVNQEMQFAKKTKNA